MSGVAWKLTITQRCGDGFGIIEATRQGSLPHIIPICTCEDVTDAELYRRAIRTLSKDPK